MSRRWGWVILALIGCLLYLSSARAQDASTITLSAPSTIEFPRITAYLNVRDGRGTFVSGLQVEDLNVLEDGQRLSVDEMNEMETGVQFVLVVNPGQPLAIRDAQGNSRFDFLANALRQWAATPRAGVADDLSLLFTGGPEVAHMAEQAELAELVSAEQRDLRDAIPSLESLSRGLDIASDPSPEVGMGRAVLFITPPPEEAGAVAALEDLANRARQAGVRIYVWMVAAKDRFNSPGATALGRLAEATGGEFFAFSGDEPIPDLESYLEPLRHAYFLAYTSRIREGGSHQIAIEVHSEYVWGTSPPRDFEVQISPPNPMFISPPAEILRRGLAGEGGNASNLEPLRQMLEILIEFPDGYPRSLQRTALYVDGDLVAENTSPPFEKFNWDLSQLATSGRRLLQVEVVDSLGLRATSVEIPVQITVQEAPRTVLGGVARNLPALAFAAVLMGGAILVLVLVLGGRLRPKPIYAQNGDRVHSDGKVASPISGRAATVITLGKQVQRPVSQLDRPIDTPALPPLAYLARSSSEGLPATSIPITSDEITLGSSPDLATIVLDDPSVEGIHARIRLSPEGVFQIADEGSVAGTWINYAPLSQGWACLEHGDLLHVGRVGLRFSSNDFTRRTEPRIIYKEPSQ